MTQSCHKIKTRKIFLKQLWIVMVKVLVPGPPFSGSIFGFRGVIKVHRENGGTLNMGAPIYLHLISWAFIRYPLLKGSLRGLNSLGTTQGYQHFPYEKWFMILSSSHCMIVQGMTLHNEKAPKMNVTMENSYRLKMYLLWKTMVIFQPAMLVFRGVFESKVVWIIPSKKKILSLVKPLGRQPKTANKAAVPNGPGVELW